MSGEGPESVPTSADPRSKRPVKKRALTPVSAQAKEVDALFARPDQEIRVVAGGGALSRPRLAAPPEIVTNVQGSSAGAGSGEFHVYKASRRREYERLRQMDEEVRREKDVEQFERTKGERATRDEERTRKNREKRERKMKARKENGKTDGGQAMEAIGNPASKPHGVDRRAGVHAPRNSNILGSSRTEDLPDAPAAVPDVPGILIHEDD